MAFQTSSGGPGGPSLDDELGEEHSGPPAPVGLCGQQDARLFEGLELAVGAGLGALCAGNQRDVEARRRLAARVVEVDVDVVTPRQWLRLKDEVLATHAVRHAAGVRVS